MLSLFKISKQFNTHQNISKHFSMSKHVGLTLDCLQFSTRHSMCSWGGNVYYRLLIPGSLNCFTFMQNIMYAESKHSLPTGKHKLDASQDNLKLNWMQKCVKFNFNLLLHFVCGLSFVHRIGLCPI